MKAVIFSLLILILPFSCDKDKKSECEENNTGYLKVVNSSSFKMDVSYYPGYYNPVTLSPGQLTIFENVPVGEVEPYAKGSFGDRWGKATIFQCQTTQYNWVLK